MQVIGHKSIVWLRRPEYFLEEVTDESVADDDEDDNFANYITGEVKDDDFDFRENDYDMARICKSLSDL